MEEVNLNEFRKRWQSLCHPRRAHVGIETQTATVNKKIFKVHQFRLVIFGALGERPDAFTLIDPSETLMSDDEIKKRLITPLVSFLTTGESKMAENPYDTAPRDTHSVSGRKLSDDETKLIQECRRAGQVIGELCARVENTGGIDKRWAAIARTDLQKGFMALIRAVAKPETF